MPSFTSGLGSQLGAGAETTYATPVTVNRFAEFTSETMKLSRAFLTSQQLRAGRMFPNSSRRSPTTRSAAGGVVMEVPNSGFGTYLNLLHGNTVAPVQQASTTAYLQTHNIGTTDPFGKSITLQVGKPSDNGTVQPFTYPGTIMHQVSFDCQTGGFLTGNLTLDANDELTGTALATPSYPTGLRSFNFTQCAVTVNSVPQTQARGINVTINEARDVARYYLGATNKAVPLTNAYGAGTLALTVDFGDLTLYNLFANGSVVPVTITFTGPTIASTYHEQLTFTMTACGLDGDSPVVPGPGVLQQAIQFVVLDDGTNPPFQITYMAVDATL